MHILFKYAGGGGGPSTICRRGLEPAGPQKASAPPAPSPIDYSCRAPPTHPFQNSCIYPRMCPHNCIHSKSDQYFQLYGFPTTPHHSHQPSNFKFYKMVKKCNFCTGPAQMVRPARLLRVDKRRINRTR